MFQVLELFSQAGKIEFEFGKIFRLCYLFSKLCIYIPIACVLSYSLTLLANFFAIVIPESELKVLALLVALISFLPVVFVFALDENFKDLRKTKRRRLCRKLLRGSRSLFRFKKC
jgi:hypothetical protein